MFVTVCVSMFVRACAQIENKMEDGFLDTKGL